jgi:N-acyl-D-amino-acid deacylase
MRTTLAGALWLTAIAGSALSSCARGHVPVAEPAGSLLIANALVVDGSGAPAFRGAVRVRGARIAAVGALTAAPGEKVIDAGGHLLAPGFIDTHSHHDRGLADEPSALAVVSQGVTTIVVGQDGESSLPLRELFAALRARPVAINVASYAGHGTLRERVLGRDFRRAATATEIAAMQRLLRRELDDGALGLSSGLEYDPGIYSSSAELFALAEVLAEKRGRYISHIRSEDRHFWAALDEAIEIGRRAGIPVQISHLKLAMRELWGRADELIARLERARSSGVEVTADVYPYAYWQSTMTVLFPERNFEDRAAAEFALRELVTPEGLRLSSYEPNRAYIGKTLAEIAKLREQDPVTTYLALIAESQRFAQKKGEGASVESVIGTSMREEDIRALLAWRHANVCSDGSLHSGHPRGYGSFPRVLARYGRDEKLFSWEKAVEKASLLGATHVGIRDRGAIAPGYFADLVLLDPARLRDNATTEQPELLASGVERVWVNGVEVFHDGAPTGQHPGRPVLR